MEPTPGLGMSFKAFGREVASNSSLPTLVHLAGASATPSKQAKTFYHGQTDHLRLTPKTWPAFLMLQYCTCHELGFHVLCGSSSVGFCRCRRGLDLGGLVETLWDKLVDR